jgi:glutathione S-transferase
VGDHVRQTEPLSHIVEPVKNGSTIGRIPAAPFDKTIPRGNQYMKIYWIKAQAPRRVLALAKYLDIDAELIEVDAIAGGLKTADYAALNPNKKAPTLVDGDVVLWESSAIMAYLCNTVGSALWPARNPTEQIDVLKWLSWNDSHWAPAVAPFYFEHVVKATFNIGPPDRAMLEGKLAEFAKYATILDDHLSAHPHPACDRLTIADFQIASMITYWQESELSMQTYPHILSWISDLMKLPAWRNPWPADPRSQG